MNVASEKQLFGLGTIDKHLDASAPTTGLVIDFPNSYTIEDIEAIWQAVEDVQKKRGLIYTSPER